MADPDVRTDEADDLNDALSTDRSVEKTLEKPPSDSLSSFDQHDITSNDGLDHSDIVYHYLDFNTEVARPVIPSDDGDTSRHPPPEPPNLKPYTSPFLWSSTRKNVMTALSCGVTAIAGYSAGAYSSGIDQMIVEWHISRVAALVGITTFTTGFGIAPMFLAPFSEINGRQPVFLASGFLFVVFQLICAVTPTFAGMLVARFFVGCFASTFSTMIGGVLSDVFVSKDRNTSMTLFSASALIGTGLGPFVSGFIGQNASFRWIFWHQVILDGVLMIAVLILFKETRGSVLLSRKAKKLNQYYAALENAGYYGVVIPPSPLSDASEKTPSPTPTLQRIRYKVLADEERASLATMLRISLSRPYYMLATEPVVFFFSLWISFSWAILYMNFSAIPLIFATTYKFNLEQTGYIFMAVVAASILFAFLATYQEEIARKFLPPSQIAVLDSPEGRLYFACVESALLPIGCLWFCITGAYPSIHFIVPALGIGCATMGVFSIYLAVFNYLADAYGKHASSALAAQSFCRNMLAGAFPLFTTPMFTTLTFQGAGGLLGGVGFLLTGVPWVLVLFGEKIRGRSKLAQGGA